MTKPIPAFGRNEAGSPPEAMTSFRSLLTRPARTRVANHADCRGVEFRCAAITPVGCPRWVGIEFGSARGFSPTLRGIEIRGNPLVAGSGHRVSGDRIR